MIPLLLTLTATPAAHAATHELDLGVGMAQLVRTDLLLSPRRYTGTLPAVGLRWRGRFEHTSHRVGIDLALGDLRSGPAWTYLSEGQPTEILPTDTTVVDLRSAHGWAVVDATWRVDVGGTVTGHLEQQYSVYAFLPVSNYLGVFTLAPWASAGVDLSQRQHLEVEGWVPVLAWIARSPYSVHDDEYLWHNRDTNAVAIIARYIGAGEPASFGTYQSAHLRTTWSLDLSRHLAVAVAGRVDAVHLVRPQPLFELQLGLSAGLRGSF